MHTRNIELLHGAQVVLGYFIPPHTTTNILPTSLAHPQVIPSYRTMEYTQPQLPSTPTPSTPTFTVSSAHPSNLKSTQDISSSGRGYSDAGLNRKRKNSDEHEESESQYPEQKRNISFTRADSPRPATRRRLEDYTTEAERFRVCLAACVSRLEFAQEASRMQRVREWVCEQRRLREGSSVVRRGDIREFPIEID
ncbi:hypothetical protein P171DRAFT_446915 [Karstenula rhodostoma CBS 690.94]|uniref:Uncharacterized protein n=1 Tax=Karstenula rhodostoma CBS 690.94 TaxID=1392251 RepID=A0A9P4P9Q3_9PLEO|nr:hypothetical protein P171DRAFT_446915 [Karstenula rhodostoma CBS 690.94]